MGRDEVVAILNGWIVEDSESQEHRKLMHDVAKLAYNTNTNISRILAMLGGFASSSSKQNVSEEQHVKAVKVTLQSLSELLTLQNTNFEQSPSFHVLNREREKMEKLVQRFGPKGPQRAIDSCLTIDAQLRILSSRKVSLRKEAVRKLQRDAFSLWQLSIMGELEKLKKFGVAIQDELERLASGKSNVEPNETVSWRDTDVLVEVFEDIASSYKSWASTLGIRIDLKPLRPIKGVKYGVDIEGIATAFQQLLQNAIKYTGELSHLSDHKETWVKCIGSQDGGEIRISVESWGVPLTIEEQEPSILCGDGYRGYFARASGVEGTGQGLALVQQVMSNNDGRIEIDTMPLAKGKKVERPVKSTFTICFPASLPDG